MVLRSSLLYLSRQQWLRGWVETSSLTRGVTHRFVAGQTLDETIQSAHQIERDGMTMTLDFLGENVSSMDEARACRDTYLESLERIRAEKLPSSVSLKLSQFGLDLSPDETRENVAQLVQLAKQMGTRVEIDMESSEYTDRTLAVVHAMQERFGCVRAVIQAYLRRSEADIEKLSAAGIPVRLCKGAYKEPAIVAFPDKADVDRNYVKLIKQLLLTGTFPAAATHDEAIVEEIVSFAKENGIGPERFEFQMLYGVRRDLQASLAKRGYQVRLYVPYGTAWYPYFMRRLAERPANLLFIAKNLVRQ